MPAVESIERFAKEGATGVGEVGSPATAYSRWLMRVKSDDKKPRRGYMIQSVVYAWNEWARGRMMNSMQGMALSLKDGAPEIVTTVKRKALPNS